MRGRLKIPLGRLIAGEPSECFRALSEILRRERPRKIILVGDAVSRNAARAGLKADAIIIDELEMRRPSKPFEYGSKRIIRVRNHAGTIEFAAWRAIEEAMDYSDVLIMVEGEEDLLTLPSILAAPVGSVVVYGQPGEGIVLVFVDEPKKQEIRRLVDAMIKVD